MSQILITVILCINYLLLRTGGAGGVQRDYGVSRFVIGGGRIAGILFRFKRGDYGIHIGDLCVEYVCTSNEYFFFYLFLKETVSIKYT